MPLSDTELVKLGFYFLSRFIYNGFANYGEAIGRAFIGWQFGFHAKSIIIDLRQIVRYFHLPFFHIPYADTAGNTGFKANFTGGLGAVKIFTKYK